MNHLIIFPSQLFVKVEKEPVIENSEIHKSPNLCHEKRNIMQEEKKIYTFNENDSTLLKLYGITINPIIRLIYWAISRQ